LQLDFHGAQAEGFAWLQGDFLHFNSVDKGTVGGAEVFNDGRVFQDLDFGVVTGDRGVIDGEIVGRVTADVICAWLELKFPGRVRTWI